MILVDAGLVQQAVLQNLVRGPEMTIAVFSNSVIRYCYWHEIKKPFRDDFLTKCKFSTMETLKGVKNRLWLYYIGAQTAAERKIVDHEMHEYVKSRRSQLGKQLVVEVLDWIDQKKRKWSAVIGMVQSLTLPTNVSILPTSRTD